jgi:hypothetical protein
LQENKNHLLGMSGQDRGKTESTESVHEYSFGLVFEQLQKQIIAQCAI